MDQIKWLRQESETWVSDGLLSDEQRIRLLERYRQTGSGNPLLIFFAIIGSLLIGAGIILVFATNWWRLPVPARLLAAFLPLLGAQGLCLFTVWRRPRSAAWREGSAAFLSLSFFAVMALIAQIFHLPGDLQPYLLLCGLFTLPAAYLLRSKTALAIYVACALYAARGWPLALLLSALSVPLFYLEIRRGGGRGKQAYLLLLQSCLACLLVFQDSWYHHASWYHTAFHAALAMGVAWLLLDAVFRLLSSQYFLTPPKVLGGVCLFITIWLAGLDFSLRLDYGRPYAVLLLCAAYALCRRRYGGLETADAFVAGAAALAVFSPFLGLAANILLLVLGVFFIVRGSKTLAVSNLNIGMACLILLIGTRFFDSALNLLTRGLVFILLGAAFLAVNLIISRKRRRQTGQPELPGGKEPAS